ncbi:hypothetical protein [Chromobacterium paludis]|uniref:Uncharacterized protein n=1 Tax=Chromobacterium paludis TaxID=2605945 RepID=A0A5C1DM95_9NEIS|nr:hypothetical protein [Chromobacterium paludis]QEL56978.1 hypothetical protein FYK34_16115 [Chromobacterium paludis]
MRGEVKRRLALCAYGNAFLADRLGMGEWYQHGLFCDVAMQFRMAASRQLIAGDFVQWLLWLRRRGALGLHLVLADEIGRYLTPVPVDCDGGIVVRFPEGNELWAGYPEASTINMGGNESSRAAWVAGLDCHWSHGRLGKEIVLAEPDWRAWRREAREQLGGGMGADAWPVCDSNPRMPGNTGGWGEWQRLPLAPFTDGNATGYLLLRELDSLDSWHDNYTHPKNDASLYWSLDEAERERLEAWHRQLQDWQAKVAAALTHVDAGEHAHLTWGEQASMPETDFHRLEHPPHEVAKGGRIMAVLILLGLLALAIVGAYAVWNYPANTLAVLTALCLVWRWARR